MTENCHYATQLAFDMVNASLPLCDVTILNAILPVLPENQSVALPAGNKPV